MNEEEFDKKWNSRYKEYVSSGHDVPSPETRERLATLETNQTFMVQEITEIKKISHDTNIKVDGIILSIATLSENIFKEADKRYASKNYERVLYGIGAFIGAGILTYVGSLLIKLIEL